METEAELIEQISGEIKGIGGKFDREVRALRSDFAAVRTMAEDAASQRNARYDDLEKYMMSVETMLRRSPRDGGYGADLSERETPETKAFSAFLRRGEMVLQPHERKALTVGDDTTGGYLASSQMYGTILARLREISPVRQIATVFPLGKGELTVPRRLTGITAAWVGEIETRPITQPSFGQVSIPAYEVSAIVEASTKLLEDADFNIEVMLAEELADQFAQSEGEAFVVGNGVKKPTGFMTYPTGTGMSQVEQVNSGNATDITADSLVKLLYALKSPYRANAVWVMNSKTMAAVRLMKDSAGRYLWDQGNGGIVLGQADSILGRRVVEMAAMPDIGAGALPIAVGDFRKAYMVADRRGITVLRDPFTKGGQGLVRFIGSLRVGGDVVLGEALKVLKVSA